MFRLSSKRWNISQLQTRSRSRRIVDLGIKHFLKPLSSLDWTVPRLIFFFFWCSQESSTSEWAHVKVIMKNVISSEHKVASRVEGKKISVSKSTHISLHRFIIRKSQIICRAANAAVSHQRTRCSSEFVFYTSVIRQYSLFCHLVLTFLTHLGLFVSGVSWGQKYGHVNGCKGPYVIIWGVGYLAQWYLRRCPGTLLLPPEHFPRFVHIGVWTKNPPKWMCFWIFSLVWIKCQVIISILHLLVEIQCYKFCICSARYCLNVYFPLILCLPSLY